MGTNLTYRNRTILTLITILYSVATGIAQTPTHYPTGQNPEPFTFWNVLFYIVIPVVLVGAWIWIRRSKAKSEDDEASE